MRSISDIGRSGTGKGLCGSDRTGCLASRWRSRLGIGVTALALVLVGVGGVTRSAMAAPTPTPWSVMPFSGPVGASNDLFGVSCLGPISCVAVGESYSVSTSTLDTLVLSWDGTTWSVTPAPTQTDLAMPSRAFRASAPPVA